MATDTAERISALADDAVRLIRRGLVTPERAHLQPAADGAVRLSVFLEPPAAHRRRARRRATTALLHRLGFAAVVVHLGVDGTADGQRPRDVLQSQLRCPGPGAPGIGTAEQAAAAIAALDGLRVIAGRATICKRAGQLLAPPRLCPRWMATDCTCSRS